MVQPFTHEPFTNFKKEENRKELEGALRSVRAELGKDYPLVINGEKVYTEDKLVSINSANKEEVVGNVSKATKDHVEQAFQAAVEAYETWRKVPVEDRAHVLFRAAAIVRRRKHKFSAWLIQDAGKPWDQADGDIAEGIDF